MVPANIHRALKIQSAQTGDSIGEIIAAWVRRHLKLGKTRKAKCQGTWNRHRWNAEGMCKRCGLARNPKAKAVQAQTSEAAK
jgi:hypothetical protein